MTKDDRSAERCTTCGSTDPAVRGHRHLLYGGFGAWSSEPPHPHRAPMEVCPNDDFHNCQSTPELTPTDTSVDTSAQSPTNLSHDEKNAAHIAAFFPNADKSKYAVPDWEAALERIEGRVHCLAECSDCMPPEVQCNSRNDRAALATLRSTIEELTDYTERIRVALNGYHDSDLASLAKTLRVRNDVLEAQVEAADALAGAVQRVKDDEMGYFDAEMGVLDITSDTVCDLVEALATYRKAGEGE